MISFEIFYRFSEPSRTGPLVRVRVVVLRYELLTSVNHHKNKKYFNYGYQVILLCAFPCFWTSLSRVVVLFLSVFHDVLEGLSRPLHGIEQEIIVSCTDSFTAKGTTTWNCAVHAFTE